MGIQLNPTTDINPIVEAINALQEQHASESAETIDLLKSVVEEIQGIRQDLQEIKRAVGGL